MADVPFVSFAFPLSSVATAATTSRTMPTRLSDVVNVLDYGADPTFTSDSRAAIQSAIDAAFGTSGSPHGLTNAASNKALFFPNGYYKLYSGPIVFTQVYGGHIFGAGKGAVILDSGYNTDTIHINGMSNTLVEAISIANQGSGGAVGGAGIGIDLNWDNSNPAGTVGLTNNVFKDIVISGGTYGVRIANGGYGGSNNLFLACFIGQVLGTFVAGVSATGAGCIATMAASATGNCVIGGNQGASTIGCNAVLGGFSLIQGLSCQNFVGTSSGPDGIDVVLSANAVGPTTLSGIRSEGPFLLKSLSLTQPVTVSGCNSTGSTFSGNLQPNGLHFVEAHGPCTVEACIVNEGDIVVREAARMNIRNCQFILNVAGVSDTRTNWIDIDATSIYYTGGGDPIDSIIEIENVVLHNPPDVSIAKQRRDTINGTSVRTRTYTVV